MGLRFRKSFKIAPGVRVNIGKKSVGISAGVKGARVSVNSKRRKTTTIGLPGTGLSYSKSSKIGSSKTDTKTADTPLPVEPLQDTSQSEDQQFTARPDLPPAQPQVVKQRGKGCGCIIYAALGLLIVSVLGSCLGIGGDKPSKGTNAVAQSAVIASLTPSNAAPTELDVGSSYTLTYTIDPSDYKVTDNAVYATTSDSDALAVSAECLSDPARVQVTLTGKAAGTASYTVRAAEGDAQQTGEITVHDRAAEQAAAEAQAQQEAAQEQAAAEAAAAQAQQEQADAAQTQQDEIVYITPSGKCWHRSANCAGDSAYAVTMDKVGKRTPCKKCAY